MASYTRAVVTAIHLSGDVEVSYTSARGEAVTVMNVPVLSGYSPQLREVTAVLDIDTAPLAIGGIYGPNPKANAEDERGRGKLGKAQA